MSVEPVRPAATAATIEAVQVKGLLDALGLKPGQSVEARVAAMLDDGLTRLAVGSGTLDVKTSQPLPVGTPLTLVVEHQGQALTLLVSEASAAAARAQPATQGLPATAAQAAAANPTVASPPAAPPGMSSPLAATNAMTAALVDLVTRGLISSRNPLDGAQLAVAARGSQEVARAAEINAAGRADHTAPREVLTGAVRSAANRQESLSPLFADLAAVADGHTPLALKSMPEPVLRAMAQVLGFRVSAEAAAAPQGLAKAIDSSGTFLEARLAALPSGAPPASDLKSALGALHAALDDWARGLGEDMPASVPKPAVHERPPLRGALPHGQPPAPASLGAEATAAEVAQVLTERTEAALARMTLLQAASVPDAREAGRPDIPLQTTVEVPIRFGAETAIMQFQIVRERDQGQEEAARAIRRGDWTMRFSLEAEPLGPIHAAVRWRDGHVGVQLWAERDGIAAHLEASRAALSDALEASAFMVDQVMITAGRPADPREEAASPRPQRLDLMS